MRKDATSLQISLELEEKLLELAKVISRKRTDNLRVFESYQSLEKHALTDSASAHPEATLFSDTNKLLYQLHRSSTAKNAASSDRSDLNLRMEFLQHDYIKTQKRVNNLYLELSRESTELNPKSISRELYRQKHIQFESYTRQIDELRNISDAIKSIYSIRKNLPEIVKTRKLRIDIWDLIERGSQIDTLVKSYISLLSVETSDPKILAEHSTQYKLLEDQILRLSEQLPLSSRNLLLAENLENYPSELLQKYRNMHNWTTSHYAPAIVKTLSNPAGYTTSNELLEQWGTINQKKLSLTDQLWTETNLYLTVAADARKSQANRHLGIDTALVIFGLLMTYWIILAIKTIKYQADYDELTALPNRRKYAGELEQYLSHAHAADSKVVLLALETQQFISLSDTLGQSVNDKILKALASSIKQLQSDSTVVAYLGVGKFAVVLYCDDAGHASVLADSVHKKMHSEIDIDGRVFQLDWNMGVSLYPDDANTVKELEIASDFALLHTRGNSTSHISFYDCELAEKLKYQLEIQSELKTAISNREFVLYFQPQFDLQRNCTDRVEALVRWNHPERGFMPPAEFLAIAEKSGFMPILGDWILNEAVRLAAQWNLQREQPITIAVNVSADQLGKPDFVSSVLQALVTHQLDSRYLEIEITESMLITDEQNITKTIQELRAIGLKIALDDFGTGYSSLSQLYCLELDIIKIDRSFVTRLNREHDQSRSIVSTIINIARTYNLEVVAEGAETEAHIQALRELEVDYVQGYYYSKPVSSSELFETLDRIDFPYLKGSKAA